MCEIYKKINILVFFDILVSALLYVCMHSVFLIGILEEWVPIAIRVMCFLNLYGNILQQCVVSKYINKNNGTESLQGQKTQ